MTLIVYGASDDLVEVEGDIREEFNPHSDDEPLFPDAPEKLVRDCFTYLDHRVAGAGERYGLLGAKFDEEVAEVKAAAIGSPAFIEELADLVEVCYALGGEERVERVRLGKKAQRGGFDKLIVMRLSDPADKWCAVEGCQNEPTLYDLPTKELVCRDHLDYGL